MDLKEFLSLGKEMSHFAIVLWEYKTALLNAGFDEKQAHEMTLSYQLFMLTKIIVIPNK